MKTSFVAIALSFAGAALASPSMRRQAPNHLYNIGGISLKHLTEAPQGWDVRFDLTQRDIDGVAQFSTTCRTSWPENAPLTGPENTVACASADYSFFFQDAVSPESYTIVVNTPDGQLSTQVATGPRYECGPYEGTIAGVDTECRAINGGQWYLTA
ncbi:hypothetical protein BDW59DRAFT_164550 [Aspergillus cavernicola]|uniref:AA1-like domain-containing protein n=1 Tax=Aspergillus cavernicola TaxID=176166 RepID=A0ABR4HZQ7_9EURO